MGILWCRFGGKDFLALVCVGVFKAKENGPDFEEYVYVSQSHDGERGWKSKAIMLNRKIEISKRITSIIWQEFNILFIVIYYF